jgi:peroxiredoxin
MARIACRWSHARHGAPGGARLRTRRGLRATRRLVILVGLLLIAVGSVSAGPPPDFKLKDVKGKQFKLGDHLGQEVIYITFWATWCVPCRRELPELQKMYDDLADKGFLVITINTDPASAKGQIQPFLRRHKLELPTLLDPDNNVHDKFNPTRELPYGVLIDRQGNVHKTYAGYRKGEEELLRAEVEKLLAEPQHGTEGDV